MPRRCLAELSPGEQGRERVLRQPQAHDSLLRRRSNTPDPIKFQIGADWQSRMISKRSPIACHTSGGLGVICKLRRNQYWLFLVLRARALLRAQQAKNQTVLVSSRAEAHPQVLPLFAPKGGHLLLRKKKKRFVIQKEKKGLLPTNNPHLVLRNMPLASQYPWSSYLGRPRHRRSASAMIRDCSQ